MWSCWLLLRRNPWLLPGNTDSRHELGVFRRRQEMFGYYRSLPQAVQARMTEINDLTSKLPATFARQRFKTKATESKLFVPGRITILDKHRTHLGSQGQCLFQAGECLGVFDEIIDSGPQRLSNGTCEDCSTSVGILGPHHAHTHNGMFRGSVSHTHKSIRADTRGT